MNRINIKNRFTMTDGIIVLGVLAVIILIAMRLTESLHYKWNWSAVWPYLFYYDEDTGRWTANMLIKGLITTLQLSVWGIILASLIGGVMGLARVSHSLFNRLIGHLYVGLIRNLPPLVIIFIFYFFISDQLWPILGIEPAVNYLARVMPDGFRWLCCRPEMAASFFSALIALALFEGAYITEIVRGGIEAVASGQWEAARALGMNRWQEMRYVIFPQAFREILPPLAGQFISLIKDSSILAVISIQELTFMGTEMMSATYLTIEIWIVVTLLYFAMTFPCSLLVQYIESVLARQHQSFRSK